MEDQEDIFSHQQTRREVVRMEKATKKYTYLDLFKKRSERCDTFMGNMEQDIMGTIEHTRIKFGLTRADMSMLLGIPSSSYTHYIKNKRDFRNVTLMLRFCYIFGYDLETLVTSSKTVVDNDSATIEMGARLAVLSDESLEELKSSIQKLNEKNHTRKALIAVISAYQETRKDFLAAAEK